MSISTNDTNGMMAGDFTRATIRRGGPVWLCAAAGLVVGSSVMCVAGCESSFSARPNEPAPTKPVTAVAKFDPGDRPVVMMINSPNLSAGQSGPELVLQQRMSPAPKDDAIEGDLTQVGPVQRVQYQGSGVRAVEVVRSLLTDLLKREFVIENAVEISQQLITLEVDEEMTSLEIMRLAGNICSLYGWALDERDGVVYVRDSSGIKRSETPVLRAKAAFGGEQPVIRVLRTKFISPTDLSKAFEAGGLLSPGAFYVAAGRTMMILDTASTVNRMADLVQTMDVAAMENVTLSVYQLGNVPAEDVDTMLKPLAAEMRFSSSSVGDSAIVFVPIRGTKRLIVLSKEPSLDKMVRTLLEQIDGNGGRERKFRYLYRPQNLTPTDLSQLITSFFPDRVIMAVSGSTGSAQLPGSNVMLKPDDDDRARLVVNDKEELLLIQALPADYAEIMATVLAVDRPRQQVALDAVIAEVSLTGNLEYGVEYFLKTLDVDGVGQGELSGTPGLPAEATGSAFFVAGDGLAVVQALQTEGQVQILSQPKLTVRDGDEGSIQVGGRTPIIKGDVDVTAQSEGNTGIRRDIDYEDTGIIFAVTPYTNESGEVRMIVSQKIQDVGRETDLGPEFTTRELKTTVIVPHGKTVVLGGIISSVKRDNQRKIPIVSEIPLLGEAFKNRSNEDTRTELMLAITPRIINAPGENHESTSEFLKAARTIRDRINQHAADFAAPFREQANELAPPPEEISTPTEEPAKADDAAVQEDSANTDTAPIKEQTS